MAIKQMNIEEGKKERVRQNCPKCGSRLLVIDSAFVKWLTCPDCKFKKLSPK